MLQIIVVIGYLKNVLNIYIFIEYRKNKFVLPGVGIV